MALPTALRHLRNLVAALSGAAAYTATLYRFLSYTERNNLPVSEYQTFALALLTLGFILSLGSRHTGRARYRPAACLLLGAFAAHAAVLLLDWQLDPTNHNLFPFEFLILAIAASPAFLGAALAHFADIARQRLQ